MIIEKTLEFISDKTPTVFEIEQFIKSNNIDPIRFAIIDKKDGKFILSVSGKKLK